MITVNVHEAKSRLSELVKAVETGGETVILQRNGIPVAELRALSSTALLDRTRIARDPALHVELAPGYDTAEPLTEEEWPFEMRCHYLVNQRCREFTAGSPLKIP